MFLLLLLFPRPIVASDAVRVLAIIPFSVRVSVYIAVDLLAFLCFNWFPLFVFLLCLLFLLGSTLLPARDRSVRYLWLCIWRGRRCTFPRRRRRVYVACVPVVWLSSAAAAAADTDTDPPSRRQQPGQGWRIRGGSEEDPRSSLTTRKEERKKENTCARTQSSTPVNGRVARARAWCQPACQPASQPASQRACVSAACDGWWLGRASAAAAAPGSSCRHERDHQGPVRGVLKQR